MKISPNVNPINLIFPASVKSKERKPGINTDENAFSFSHTANNAITSYNSVFVRFCGDDEYYEHRKNFNDLINQYNELTNQNFEMSDFGSEKEKFSYKFEILQKIVSNKQLYENESINRNIVKIINNINTDEECKAKSELLDKYTSDENWNNNDTVKRIIGKITSGVYRDNRQKGTIAILNKYLSDENWQNCKKINEKLEFIAYNCNTEDEARAKIIVADKILSNKILAENEGIKNNTVIILQYCNSDQNAEVKVKIADKYSSNPKLYENENLREIIWSILHTVSTKSGYNIKSELFDKFSDDKKWNENDLINKLIGNMLNKVTNEGEEEAIEIICDKYLSKKELTENEYINKNIEEILKSAILSKKKAEVIVKLIEKYFCLKDVDTYGKDDVDNIFHLMFLTSENIENDKRIKLFDKYLGNEMLYTNENLRKNIYDLMLRTFREESYAEMENFLNDYIRNPKLNKSELIQNTLSDILKNTNNKMQRCYNDEIIKFALNYEISEETFKRLIKCYEKTEPEEIEKLFMNAGREKFEEITKKIADFITASKFAILYNVENINEIPIADKKNILREMVKNNNGMFQLSNKQKQNFPLIPSNTEEYCLLLPQIAKSIGIETIELTTEEICEFEKSITNMSKTLSMLSDKKFNKIKIDTEYKKEDFINDVIYTLNDLTVNERQCVYDFYGFELKKTERNKEGYSIYGYPLDMNYEEKLTQIQNQKVRAKIEKLRGFVINFTKENKVKTNNPSIEKELNTILKLAPELYTCINKKQHETHDFDIMKHSLKVMQKIVQNKNYKKLNNSDKKVMLLAAMYHDISKAEGCADKTHSKESSFDAFYLTKKFKLNKEEQNKLYTLIKNHEWYQYTNTSTNKGELNNRLQSVAFEFRNGDMFKMAQMFTIADMKGVKSNDGFYVGKNKNFDDFSRKINKYTEMLKNTEPVLPITKIPKASELDKYITNVNSDGTTNIKGVYKTASGITAIKYNEIENWEAIGFPKGTKSRGILVKNQNDGSEIDTGNIKFFVHGLEKRQDIAKFDAFSLPDSEALLSVSYAERPESKYKFFRTQGVILDVDSEYIYGGGRTDSGSGYKKDIKEFKENYASENFYKKNREFVSELLKETLDLSKEEYIDFVSKNKNKSMLEIEPKEYREKLIEAFANISSHCRLGMREYNEMFVSNPRVMGVFAYDNLVEYSFFDRNRNDGTLIVPSFVENQQPYLKEYAKRNDLILFVFGD